jgi:hypothetical protein
MIAGDCPLKHKNCPALLLLDKHRDKPAGMAHAECADCGATFTGLSMGAGDLFWTVAPKKAKRVSRKRVPSKEASD